MSTPEEGAAYARQILDTLHEYDTDAVDFRVQLAIAEALTAIAQVIAREPSPEEVGEHQVQDAIKRARAEGISGPFLGWVK